MAQYSILVEELFPDFLLRKMRVDDELFICLHDLCREQESANCKGNNFQDVRFQKQFYLFLIIYLETFLCSTPPTPTIVSHKTPWYTLYPVHAAEERVIFNLIFSICSLIEDTFLPSIQLFQLDKRQIFPFYSVFALYTLQKMV